MPNPLLFCILLYHLDNEMDGGFHVDVKNGSKLVDEKCQNDSGIRTRIVLTCNSSAEWTSQDLSDIIHVQAVGHCEVISNSLHI